MPEQRQSENREPVIHKKDRMAWPLVALVAAVVLLVVIFAVMPTAPKVAAPAPGAEAPAQPNAGQLQLTNVKITPSPASGGGTLSVRLAAQLQNVGGPAVTGATVEATFNDDKGAAVFSQAQPIEKVAMEGHSDKEVAFKDSPLKPNDMATFEVEFTGVPATWNKRPPALRIVDVETNAPAQPVAQNDAAPAIGTATGDSSKPSPVTPKRGHKGQK
jgi:hypothetical protein